MPATCLTSLAPLNTGAAYTTPTYHFVQQTETCKFPTICTILRDESVSSVSGA